MKKIIKLIFIVILSLVLKNVNAEEYNTYTLIPVNTHATVTTGNFSYNDFYYNDNEMEANYLKDNYIIFDNITNISDEELPVSISIGLFDSNKINIGTVNYCSKTDKVSAVAGTILKPNDSAKYVIEVPKRLLEDGKNVTDIEYIAILSDNNTCSTGKNLAYVGKTVDEIKNNQDDYSLSSSTKYFIYFALAVLIIIILFFLIKRIVTGGKTRSDLIREQYNNQNIEHKPHVSPYQNNNNLNNVVQNGIQESNNVQVQQPVQSNNNNNQTTKSNINQQPNTENNTNSNNESNDLLNMYK